MKQSPAFEPFALQTAIATSLVRQQRIGTLTHFLFGETRPGPDGQDECVIVQRLAIPNELVPLIARAMLAGNGEVVRDMTDGEKAVLQ